MGKTPSKLKPKYFAWGSQACLRYLSVLDAIGRWDHEVQHPDCKGPESVSGALGAKEPLLLGFVFYHVQELVLSAGSRASPLLHHEGVMVILKNQQQQHQK